MLIQKSAVRIERETWLRTGLSLGLIRDASRKNLRLSASRGFRPALKMACATCSGVALILIWRVIGRPRACLGLEDFGGFTGNYLV